MGLEDDFPNCGGLEGVISFISPHCASPIEGYSAITNTCFLLQAFVTKQQQFQVYRDTSQEGHRQFTKGITILPLSDIIVTLLQENERLDVENKSLQQQWRETEELLKNMRREQENIGLLRKHLTAVENGDTSNPHRSRDDVFTFPGVKIPGCPGGRNTDLTRQVEELAQMNRELKDRNDELVLHLRPSDGG